MLQLPFAMLALVQPAVAAVNLSLMPHICATFYPGQDLDRCVGWGVAKVAARGVVLPMLVVYLAELRARRVFLGSEAAAAVTAASAQERPAAPAQPRMAMGWHRWR